MTNLNIHSDDSFFPFDLWGEKGVLQIRDAILVHVFLPSSAMIARIPYRVWNRINSSEDLLLAEETHRQIFEYLAGRRTFFDLPWGFFSGTPFQQRIWKVISSIPYGQVISYAQLAAKAGSPNAFRAAGQAAHCNPLPLILPCHRVVAADGNITGFGGGLELKRNLLLLGGIPLEKRGNSVYISL